MLDTHARKLVQPAISGVAKVCIKLKLTPNVVTTIALFLGVMASFILYFYEPILAVIILWISGFLDALDGTIARMTNKTSQFGTVMDITFDRVVEIGIIISIATLYPKSSFNLMLLLGAIVLSITIFLSVGATSNKKSEKTFHYQAGLAERTEGFIFFSLMMLFPKVLNEIIIVFIIVIMITFVWRFFEAKKILK